jgi:hypothetical protein
MTPAAKAVTSAEAAAAEATNLESTLSAIDKVVLDSHRGDCCGYKRSPGRSA